MINFIDEKSAYEAGLALTDKTDFEEIYPTDIDPKFVWHFIRGYFEGNGATLNSPKKTVLNFPLLTFSVRKAAYLEKICSFINSPYIYSFDSEKSLGTLQITGTNALDLLGKLYENTEHAHFHMKKCYSDWCIIDVVKKFHNKTTLYTTGIKVKPAFGWYLDVVPRSSIIKSGYMLANNVGIIDRAYTGEIMIALIKVDESAPDLELPLRIAQMIPRKIAHVEFTEVSDIERTTRNDGGFGSTG